MERFAKLNQQLNAADKARQVAKPTDARDPVDRESQETKL